MADTNRYSKLTKASEAFSSMMTEFGIVTVMNAEIYEIPAVPATPGETDFKGFDKYTPEDLRTLVRKDGSPFTKLATIDTLKVANVTIEGPTKTVSGGQYSNPLIKFGKTARLEMQDALGRADALEAFGGVVNEYSDETMKNVALMHSTSDFAPARLIIGDSFFVSRKNGQQVKVDIIFYQVLPDSIMNLTQDAEGDATVFDLNADLLTTNIIMHDKTGAPEIHGVFYTILAKETTPTT